MSSLMGAAGDRHHPGCASVAGKPGVVEGA